MGGGGGGGKNVFSFSASNHFFHRSHNSKKCVNTDKKIISFIVILRFFILQKPFPPFSNIYRRLSSKIKSRLRLEIMHQQIIREASNVSRSNQGASNRKTCSMQHNKYTLTTHRTHSCVQFCQSPV